MKSRTRLRLTGILFFAAIATLQVTADDDVLAVVRQIGNAYRDADVATLENLVTENYVHTNSSSKPIDRKAWLGWVASRAKAMEEGRLAVLEYETSDLEVVRHGASAIVTGMNRVVRVRDGKQEESAVRFTMVFVETASGWKRAAFQDCRIETN